MSLIALACLLAVVACSGPDNGDEEDPTATEVAVSDETPRPTTAPTATSEPTPTVPEPTATAAATATATEEPIPSPTATEPESTATPQPSGGDPLEIDGQAVDQVIQADDSGAWLYGISGEALYLSDDGGDSWEEVGTAQPGSMIVALNDPTMLYAGDRDGCMRGFSDADFTRSFDSGATWETMPDNSGYQPLLAFDMGQPLVYGTSCGLSVSADGGETWQEVPDLAGTEIFDLATQRDIPLQQVLVVGVSEGGTGNLYLLETLDPLSPTLVDTLTEFWGDAVVDWREGRIAIATATGVGISNDQGQTFEWTRAGLEDATLEQDPLVEGLPAGIEEPIPHFTSIRIVPGIPNLIWLGGNHGVYLSTDGGFTWTPIDQEIDVESIAVSITSGRVYVSGAGQTQIYTLDGQ